MYAKLIIFIIYVYMLIILFPICIQANRLPSHIYRLSSSLIYSGELSFIPCSSSPANAEEENVKLFSV